MQPERRQAKPVRPAPGLPLQVWMLGWLLMALSQLPEAPQPLTLPPGRPAEAAPVLLLAALCQAPHLLRLLLLQMVPVGMPAPAVRLRPAEGERPAARVQVKPG